MYENCRIYTTKHIMYSLAAEIDSWKTEFIITITALDV